MKLYKIGVGDGNKYAYASGYRPFDGMHFIDEMPVQFRERRIKFWDLDPGEPGISIGESGSRWPDILYCGLHDPTFFFSIKVIESLENNKISLRRITRIPMGSIESKKLRAIAPPEYFVVEAIPGISVDYVASGFAVDALGNFDVSAPRTYPPPIAQYDPETWSGSDFFCQKNGPYGPRYLDILCTDRIREIAKDDGWTNVSFQRVRVKGINPFTGRPEQGP